MGTKTNFLAPVAWPAMLNDFRCRAFLSSIGNFTEADMVVLPRPNWVELPIHFVHLIIGKLRCQPFFLRLAPYICKLTTISGSYGKSRMRPIGGLTHGKFLAPGHKKTRANAQAVIRG